MNQLKSTFSSKISQKILSILFLAASIFSIYVFYRSTLIQYEQSIANWELGSMVAMIFSASLLSFSHKDIYWATKPNAKKLDERQIQVRRRVLELSYRSLVVIFPTVTMLTFPWIFQSITANTLPKGGYSAPFLQMLMFLCAFPSAVASWQKDA